MTRLITPRSSPVKRGRLLAVRLISPGASEVWRRMPPRPKLREASGQMMFHHCCSCLGVHLARESITRRTGTIRGPGVAIAIVLQRKLRRVMISVGELLLAWTRLEPYPTDYGTLLLCEPQRPSFLSRL